jgi:signal peptidase I
MTLPDARARISFRRVLTYILLAFIVILPVRVFVAQPFLVSGGSMTPTFSSGARI